MRRSRRNTLLVMLVAMFAMSLSLTAMAASEGEEGTTEEDGTAATTTTIESGLVPAVDATVEEPPAVEVDWTYRYMIPTALALAARFPDHEEYVISSSEFQRVKNRLLRLSNARAATTGAIAAGEDGGAPGRPTLKRRQPTPDDSTTTTPDGETKPAESTAPPKLKRKDVPKNPDPDKP